MLNNRPTALLVRGGLKSVVNSNDRTQTEKVSAKNKATDNQGATIARAVKPEAKRPVKAGEVQVQIYFKYYYFKVDTALAESIRLTQINHLRASKRQAPNGSKGYKAAAADLIHERLVAPWKNRATSPNGSKVEFGSPATKGYTVPFSIVSFG